MKELLGSAAPAGDLTDLQHARLFSTLSLLLIDERAKQDFAAGSGADVIAGVFTRFTRALDVTSHMLPADCRPSLSRTWRPGHFALDSTF